MAVHVHLPSVFDISAHPVRTPTLEAISKLRGNWPRRGGNLEISLPDTFAASLPASLLLAAELHDLIAASSVPPAIAISSRHPNELVPMLLNTVEQVREMGRKEVDFRTHETGGRSFLCSGSEVIGKAFSERVDPLGAVLGAERLRKLYDAVVEGMGNALEHAYREPRFNRSMSHRRANRWWFAGQWDEHNIRLSLVDLGIGIPRAFRAEWIVALSNPSAWLKNAVPTNAPNLVPDEIVIGAAHRASVTSTLKAGRGQGLAQICNTEALGPGGIVSIHSGRGVLTKSADNPSDLRLTPFLASCYGTVISWTLPIPQKGMT